VNTTPNDPHKRIAEEPRWFVRVEGTIYGPFTDTVLASFLDEGRVTAQSFIRQGTIGEFRQVATLPALMNYIQNRTNHTVQDVTSFNRQTCFIMAEVRSGQSMAFLKTLQSLGDVQRIGQTIWMVSGPANPQQIIEALSPPLSQEDRIFVLAANEAEHAGFNLGRDVDARIQAMITQKT
jgi:hypothetical protein